MQNKKLLIISYYWPPSGGAGVQRWLKLSKYLVRLNIDVFVLTVDPEQSSYPVFDTSLEKDIDSRIKIYKTNSFEPINLYSKMVGKEKVPTAGFSNVNNQKLSQKLINALRSNLFIPDPRVGWNNYAFSEAKKIIDAYKIDNVITTSPTHSTQLIGLKLKKYYQNNIQWIVDFRDPWTDIYYYKLLNHSFISHFINKNYEREVIEKADKIVTVSNGFKSIFLSKTERILENKISVIPNGFDQDDFKDVDREKYKNKIFTIRYTGTMAESYQPKVFFDGLSIVKKQYPDIEYVFESIGILSQEIKDYIEKLEIPYTFISSVPHNEIVKYQASADLLLLVIPKVKKGEGIVPGKVFEYIASETPIICISESNYDVNLILNDTQTGVAFDRKSEQEIANHIISMINEDKKNVNTGHYMEYSRKSQASRYKTLLQ